MIVYKLFKMYKNGELHPLYMDKSEPTPIGELITHRIGKGSMALRAGWHSSEWPVALHIGAKNEAGKVAYREPWQVWCKCYVPDDEIRESIPRYGFKDVPAGKFYRFKTNPNMIDWWIISDRIKVLKILTDKEVYRINSKRGIHDLPPKQ